MNQPVTTPFKRREKAMSEGKYGPKERAAKELRDDLQAMLAKVPVSQHRYLLNAIQKAGEMMLELEMAGLVSGEDENSVIKADSDE